MPPRTVVIGDIHGCFDEFRDLIQKVGPVEGDRIVCLGDFMDKGFFAPECVAYARANGFESVKGNHDEKHVRWRRHEDARAAALAAMPALTKKGRARQNQVRKNPMRPLAPADAEANSRLSPEDVEWLDSLPITLALGSNWLAVHGGFDPKKSLEDQDPSTMLRARWFDKEGKHVAVEYEDPGDGSAPVPKKPPEGSYHWTSKWGGPQSVVFGHEAFDLEKPLWVRQGPDTECWGIDTGCVHGGHLTALIIERRELVQVKARQVYQVH